MEWLGRSFRKREGGPGRLDFEASTKVGRRVAVGRPEARTTVVSAAASRPAEAKGNVLGEASGQGGFDPGGTPEQAGLEARPGPPSRLRRGSRSGHLTRPFADLQLRHARPRHRLELGKGLDQADDRRQPRAALGASARTQRRDQ